MSFLDRLLGRAKPKTTLDLLRMREALPAEQAVQLDQRTAGLPVISPTEARELMPPTESDLNPLLSRAKTDRRGFLELLRTGAAAAAIPSKARAVAPVIDPMVKRLLEGAAENPLSIMSRAVQKGGDLDPWIDELVDRGGMRPSGALQLLRQGSDPEIAELMKLRGMLRGEAAPEKLSEWLYPHVYDQMINHFRAPIDEYLGPVSPSTDLGRHLVRQYGLEGPVNLPQNYLDLYKQANDLASQRRLITREIDTSRTRGVKYRIGPRGEWEFYDTGDRRPDKFWDWGGADEAIQPQLENIFEKLRLPPPEGVP